MYQYVSGWCGDTGLLCVWGLCVRVISSVTEERDLQSVAVSARVQTASQKPEGHSRDGVTERGGGGGEEGERERGRGEEGGRESEREEERVIGAYLLPVPAFTISLLKEVFLCGEQYIQYQAGFIRGVQGGNSPPP